MKVGYSTSSVATKKLCEVCDRIVIGKKKNHKAKDFLVFVEKYQKEELIIYSVEDLGLQLIQILPALLLLNEQKKILNFIDKGNLAHLSDETYFYYLTDFIKIEQRILTARSRDVQVMLKEEGRTPGRPPIDNRLVKRIQFMYGRDKKSMREIAEICDLSLGTVHKYVNMDNLDD